MYLTDKELVLLSKRTTPKEIDMVLIGISNSHLYQQSTRNQLERIISFLVLCFIGENGKVLIPYISIFSGLIQVSQVLSICDFSADACVVFKLANLFTETSGF